LSKDGQIGTATLGIASLKDHSDMCAVVAPELEGLEVDAVRRLLLATLPLASAESVRVIEALVQSGGLLHDTQRFAVDLQMGSRYRVARLLRRESLPQLEELAAWIRLVRWLVRWERGSGSLSRIALDDGLETSVCCRTVRRLTGTTWTEARNRGPEWAILLLVQRCGSLAPRRAAGYGEIGRAG
jgi:hypothetical protein